MGLDHPRRHELAAELHARPSPRLTAPFTAVHLVLKPPRDAASRDRGADVAQLNALLSRHGSPAAPAGASHHAVRLGRDELRWENHTEFTAITAFAAGATERPFDPGIAGVFPADWQAAAPGHRLVAAMVHVDALPDDPAEVLAFCARHLDPEAMAVVWVLEESAIVAGDFRIDAAGFMRFAVFVRAGAGAGRTGRIVQRVLEIETYRAMSMLGLPRAREVGTKLTALDPRLSALAAQMAEGGDPEAALDQLLGVSAELEALADSVAFRFSASAAYRALVTERVAALRETRFSGRQTLSEFMARRYAPALRTIASAETRLQATLDRVERAGELLRTRVDVARSAQNRDLLESMDRRADLQLRLQHTVEGLSVVAISYYAVGLAGYALGPVAKLAHVDKAVLTAGLVPVTVLAVWAVLRRIKARTMGPGH